MSGFQRVPVQPSRGFWSIAFLLLVFSLFFLTQCTDSPGKKEPAAETPAQDGRTSDRKESAASEKPSDSKGDAGTVDQTAPDENVSEPRPEPAPEPTGPEEFVGGDAGGEPTPENKSENPPEVDPGDSPDSAPDSRPDQGPPPSPCAAPPANAWKSLSAGSYKVGSFTLEVASNNLLQWLDSQRSKVILFQVPRQSPVIAEKVSVKIEEHQGSFDVKEKSTLVCRDSLLAEVAVNGSTVSLRGTFQDTNPACKGLSFQWHFCPAEKGHLRYALTTSDSSFNALSLRLRSTAKERLMGMGMQSLHDNLNLKGKKVPVLVQEGGVGRGRQPISAAVNSASKGSAGSEVTTYYTMPYFLTERWSAVLLENSEVSFFDFTQNDFTTIRLFASAMRGRILSATSPLQMLERLTAYTGRMPLMPDWVNKGAIVALARSTADNEKLIKNLLAKGTKIAAIWNQTWPGMVKTFIGEQVLWNWAYNPNYHPTWTSFVSKLQKQDIKVLCYMNPMFVDVPKEAGKVTRNLYKEGIAKGYFIKNSKGDVYKIKVTAFDVALLDLTNPAARKWAKEVIKTELLKKAGCSGWMADFAEALPFDAKMHSGVSADVYHNLYPVDWIKLHYEALKETGNLGKILVFNRSGFTHSSKYSVLLWQGDQLTTWDKYDGLINALHGLLNGGLSGISLNHSDTGGYTSLSYVKLGYTREKDLLKRWAEMNAFTAVLRTHEGNQPKANAQVYSNDDAIKHFARMSKIYAALGFYRKTLFKEATTKGWPVVRHLLLHYPNDPGSRTADKQFLLGSEILVAPYLKKCLVRPLCSYKIDVYLPPGKWVHLWTGKTYGDAAKGTKVNVKAPLGSPAVFTKAGSSVGKTFLKNLKAAGISGLP